MGLAWAVEMTPGVARAFRKLEGAVQEAMHRALTGLATELTAGTSLSQVNAKVVKLTGRQPDEWRLRVGDYRAIFRLSKRLVEAGQGQGEPYEVGLVIVTQLGHRREVYR